VRVLNDTETCGQGVAKTFKDEAVKRGMTVVGEDSWKKSDANYTALWGSRVQCRAGLLRRIRQQRWPAHQDKVSALGPKVKLMAPDGFTGYPDFLKLAEADGAYLSFAGLSTDPLKAAGGVPAKFLADYKTKYGQDPRSPYALYGVQALQVILAAIAKSTAPAKVVGTRSSGQASIPQTRRSSARPSDRPGDRRREREGHQSKPAGRPETFFKAQASLTTVGSTARCGVPVGARHTGAFQAGPPVEEHHDHSPLHRTILAPSDRPGQKILLPSSAP
jgi:hypothetical protein